MMGPVLVILMRRRPVFNRSELRLLAASLCVLLLAPSVAAAVWVGGRARHIGPEMDRLVRTAAIADPGASPRPLAIVWRTSADGMSRRLWIVRDRLDALHLNDFMKLFGLLDRAAESGHRAVVFVSDVPLPIVAGLAAGRLDVAGWEIDESVSWVDGEIAVFVLRRSSPEAESERLVGG